MKTFFTSNQNHPDILVFSHLRWEFVFQRPQHIMTRLAQNRRIMFIEEPISHEAHELGTARVYKPMRNITVVQPRIRSIHQTGLLSGIVENLLQEANIKNFTTWFYSPSFIDILSSIQSKLIVYDCMDELSAFKGAPPQLVENERKLMTYADVVFTGGKSLYESKSKKIGNVYCFPSSVDEKHFAMSTRFGRNLPIDIARLPKPIVGYYGVIDERIDTDLLRTIAQKLPNVTFVMIGPVAKIDPATLPILPNINYLGQKSYDELPAYLAGFDIAMMPFAKNEATKFISPTKTLEFMAAGKVIVSTSITDVVRDYKHVVEIADDYEQFVSGISTLLRESWKKQEKRLEKQKKIIKETSWDKTVHFMEQKMIEASINKNPLEGQEQFPLVPLSWKIAYDAS